MRIDDGLVELTVTELYDSRHATILYREADGFNRKKESLLRLTVVKDSCRIG
jgi:hypothetical protein